MMPWRRPALMSSAAGFLARVWAGSRSVGGTHGKSGSKVEGLMIMASSH
jgi:hypothetical protein